MTIFDLHGTPHPKQTDLQRQTVAVNVDFTVYNAPIAPFAFSVAGKNFRRSLR